MMIYFLYLAMALEEFRSLRLVRRVVIWLDNEVFGIVEQFRLR